MTWYTLDCYFVYFGLLLYSDQYYYLIKISLVLYDTNRLCWMNFHFIFEINAKSYFDILQQRQRLQILNDIEKKRQKLIQSKQCSYVESITMYYVTRDILTIQQYVQIEMCTLLINLFSSVTGKNIGDIFRQASLRAPGSKLKT